MFALGTVERDRGAVRPGRKVQLALDLQETAPALGVLRQVADLIDIIEVGTVLCLSRGMEAVRNIRAAYPNHLLLADIRIAEAGGLLSRLAFDAGADLVTVVSGAAPSSFKVVAEVAETYGADVQVELSDGWSFDLVERCRDLGIRHFILHRSRDAEAEGSLAWPQSDLDAISRIVELGGRVSVTGGMTVPQVAAFAELPAEIFIAGRALYGAEDPRAAATDLSDTVRGLPALPQSAFTGSRP